MLVCLNFTSCFTRVTEKLENIEWSTWLMSRHMTNIDSALNESVQRGHTLHFLLPALSITVIFSGASLAGGVQCERAGADVRVQSY